MKIVSNMDFKPIEYEPEEIKYKMIEWTKEIALKLDNPHITIEFSNRMSKVWAKCNYKSKTIIYNIGFIYNNIDNEKVLKALCIHEACHLIFPNHSKNFETLCSEFGLNSKKGRLYYLFKDIRIKPKYIGICGFCGKKYYIYKKRNHDSSCGFCSKGYNPKYTIEWKFNYDEYITQTNE